MSKLSKAAESVIEALKEALQNGEITDREDLDQRIHETVGSACTYTVDNWDVAREANVGELDSGLWEGATDIDDMIAGIAYAAIEQEVHNLLHDIEDPDFRSVIGDDVFCSLCSQEMTHEGAEKMHDGRHEDLWECPCGARLTRVRGEGEGW